jgi:hypothetical protein
MQKFTVKKNFTFLKYLHNLFLHCRDQAIIRNSVAVADVLGRSANNRLTKILTRNNTQISARTVWGIFHVTILVHLLRYNTFNCRFQGSNI